MAYVVLYEKDEITHYVGTVSDYKKAPALIGQDCDLNWDYIDSSSSTDKNGFLIRYVTVSFGGDRLLIIEDDNVSVGNGWIT